MLFVTTLFLMYEPIKRLSRVNATLPEGLRLRRFVSLHKEFDADDGEITRTRKLRRNVVEERYRPIIEALYCEALVLADEKTPVAHIAHTAIYRPRQVAAA